MNLITNNYSHRHTGHCLRLPKLGNCRETACKDGTHFWFSSILTNITEQQLVEIDNGVKSKRLRIQEKLIILIYLQTVMCKASFAWQKTGKAN